MAYIIRFTDPHGAVTYFPFEFGFTVHEHTADIRQARTFTEKPAAYRSLYGYIHPMGFWESERSHAANMRAKFRTWACEVIEADHIPQTIAA